MTRSLFIQFKDKILSSLCTDLTILWSADRKAPIQFLCPCQSEKHTIKKERINIISFYPLLLNLREGWSGWKDMHQDVQDMFCSQP